MIDVGNKLNASILILAIDLPQQPITVWTEVTRAVCKTFVSVYFLPQSVSGVLNKNLPLTIMLSKMSALNLIPWGLRRSAR